MAGTTFFDYARGENEGERKREKGKAACAINLGRLGGKGKCRVFPAVMPYGKKASREKGRGAVRARPGSALPVSCGIPSPEGKRGVEGGRRKWWRRHGTAGDGRSIDPFSGDQRKNPGEGKKRDGGGRVS